ncbi:MAG: fumarylacetoacetase [Alphaproteobacteria bacterium HGW-Alphaproteobacteria-13]|jgi:fumarylacetoacetase|nr:MAG: fumarylacetoacetase [Alphaproteobacteria bacterium HGW-Alphaproteobacteria-13]
MSRIDHTHDANATSWVAGADGHAEFPVQNLPLGLFSGPDGGRRIGAAIGDFIVDLTALGREGRLPAAAALQTATLNALFAEPADVRRALRHALFALLTGEERRAEVEGHLHPASACALHVPFAIGDYTDFYVGIHHATHIGSLFRPDSPLLPNYKHVPIGYHGRASSVRPSGTAVRRPNGQRKAPDADTPLFGPSTRLDYELELGVWIAGDSEIGVPVPIAEAGERFGGLCLLNDWSARDIQAWEYQPLGPFLSKNFLTTISPWVVTAEALAPFRAPQPPRAEGDPRPLPYLWDATDQRQGALDLTLEVHLASAAMRARGDAPVRLSHGPASNMYWTIGQMIAHHASNGCDLHAGDLLGTGTISGPVPGSFGSLIEMTRGGQQPVALPTGEQRTFLEDGDALTLSARAEKPGFRTIGFGPCSGIVESAPS